MSFRHGKATGVYLAGFNASKYLNSAEISREIETAETTGFESEGKTYIAGLSDGTISVSGLYDGSKDAIDDIFEGLIAAGDAYPASIFFDGGVAIGRAASIARVQQTSKGVTSGIGDVVACSGEMQADGGVWTGKCLHAKAPVQSATITAQSVDWGAKAGGAPALSSKGVAHIHAFGNTRTTGTNVKVQFSADGSVWADAASYTIPAGQDEGIAIDTTLQNQRYARAVIAPGSSGTGTATIIVAFARN